ncbi:MAG TPA: lysophospholipase [Spirochaetia bacterium]|nr:lysophospholipase [Spirochaetia bacterium]
MNSSTFTHTSSDGVGIFVRRWAGDSPPKALLLVVHGVAEHSGRYARLASALTVRGYEVWAPDHRGHGGTARASGGRGWFAARDGFRRVVDDLEEVRGRMAAERPGLPVFLLGHSMGSSLARCYVSLYGKSLAGCALSGPLALDPFLAAAGDLIVAAGRALQGGRGIANFAHGLTLGSYAKPFSPVRTPQDWLSRDPAEVDAYIADPDCGFVCTWDWYRDMNEGTKFVEDPRNVARIPQALPIYIFAGAADPVGAASGGAERLAASYRAAGIRDVSLRLYPGGRHESLNEVNRDEVTRDLADWLDGRAGAIRNPGS